MNEPTPDRDYHEGLDALQADMARHQRRFAPDVTAEANHALAVATIERLEREHADQRPTIAPPVPAAPAAFTESREVDVRKYTIDKVPDAPMFRSATDFEHDVMRHAKPRIELLLTKRDSGPLGSPSWHTRTLAAMFHKVKAIEALKAGLLDDAAICERMFQLDLYELLEASNAAFGDWRKDEPSKLIVC